MVLTVQTVTVSNLVITFYLSIYLISHDLQVTVITSFKNTDNTTALHSGIRSKQLLCDRKNGSACVVIR